MASAYIAGERWSTIASGSAGTIGVPVTLTWSVAPDGAAIPEAGASNLVAYFDGLFGVTAPQDDLTQRPWFALLQQSFDRWSELGGVAYHYEPNDDGAMLRTTSGELGVRGDVRIGGTFVDGPNETLAHSWLPQSGDLIVDTGETNLLSNSSNNYRPFRNSIMHELGHTLGFLHIESSSDALLMEPALNNNFDGPQLDDIRGLHALYGDALEKTHAGQGNGIFSLATQLGAIPSGETRSIGASAAGDQIVSQGETDFVSIANRNDVDFYSFVVAAPTVLEVSLTPLGGILSQGPVGGPQSVVNANARSDLAVAVFASDGATLLDAANRDGAGAVESIVGLTLSAAGKYYVRVTGASSNVQLYQLQLTATAFSTDLAGDYNSDGSVDAADYTMWRDNLYGPGTLANDDSPGIGEDDYVRWKANFGQPFGRGSLGMELPEPSFVAMALVAGFGFAPGRFKIAIGYRRVKTA